MKGLPVHVLRSSLGDCTNGGITGGGTPGGRDSFVLLMSGAELGPFDPSERLPALYLATWYGRVIACPEELEPKYPRRPNQREDCSISHLGGWMFGGNFVYSRDSRFAELTPGGYPIPVYDRKEW